LLKKQADVNLGIYNINGQLVKVLRQQKQEPGQYLLKWNGDDEKGNLLPQGTYLLKAEIKQKDMQFSETKRLSIIRR